MLSAEIKIIPALTEEEIQKVVEGSGITLLKQVESDSYTVHGSWKSLQRARDILVKIYVRHQLKHIKFLFKRFVKCEKEFTM